MGNTHWSDAENDYFQHFIIPHSIYAQYYHDGKNGGMTFEELAKVMQAEMKKQGIENRKYTQTNLFQKYYSTQGKKGISGPHAMLSKARLDTVKQMRAWLGQTDADGGDDDGDVVSHADEAGDDDDGQEGGNFIEDNSPHSSRKRRRLQQQSQPRSHSSNMASQQQSGHSNDLQPQQHSSHKYPFHNMYHSEYSKSGQPFSKKPGERTSFFHPVPQFSPGGTLRRIYDDEDICPPEAPNFLSIYGAREPTKFLHPHFAEDNAFTHTENEKRRQRTAEYNKRERIEQEEVDQRPREYNNRQRFEQGTEYNKRKRAEQEQEQEDMDDEDTNDTYPETFSPNEPVRIRAYTESTFCKPRVIIDKTPTKPAAKMHSARKPSATRSYAAMSSASETRTVTPSKQRYFPASSSHVKSPPVRSSLIGDHDGPEQEDADHENGDHDGPEQEDADHENGDHDDDDHDSPTEEIDPRYVGKGGDSPIGVPRFATRPLSFPKRYKAGITFPDLPRPDYKTKYRGIFAGGFIDPEDDVDNEDEADDGCVMREEEPVEDELAEDVERQ